jgi:hypothetical protein
MVVNRLVPTKPLDSKESGENVLEHLDVRLESFEDLMGHTGIATLRPTLKHQALNLFLALDRREIRKRQEVVTFEVSALVHELLSALVINHPRHCMREMALLRIAGCPRPDEIRV